MNSGLTSICPICMAHLRMNREQISLYKYQVAAPIIRIQAVKFYKLPRLKPTLRTLLPLLPHRRHPLLSIALVYYIPSMGKRLLYYPFDDGERGS